MAFQMIVLPCKIWNSSNTPKHEKLKMLENKLNVHVLEYLRIYSQQTKGPKEERFTRTRNRVRDENDHFFYK